MHIFIKKSVQFFFIFFIFFSLSGPVSGEETPPKPESNQPAADYVARVNGVEISPVELERKFNLIKERYASMGVPMDDSKLNEYKESILTTLIDQEVLYQEAVAQGIKIDPEVIKTELDDFKTQFETEAAFKDQIAEMGYTEDAILSQIKQSKTIQKFIEEKVLPTISITDADVKTYYDTHPEEFEVPERVHASHILLKVDPNASEESKAETRKKIEAIKARLDKGEDFAKLAEENSDCPSSAKGGDLGFFAHGQMVKPFEEAAFALKPGEISDVVETRFGYHIIKAQEKEEGTTLAYDDVKEKLTEKLKKDKFKEMFPSYIESIKAKYKIEVPGNAENKATEDKPAN